jgi:hypothetical protein
MSFALLSPPFLGCPLWACLIDKRFALRESNPTLQLVSVATLFRVSDGPMFSNASPPSRTSVQGAGLEAESSVDPVPYPNRREFHWEIFTQKVTGLGFFISQTSTAGRHQ